MNKIKTPTLFAKYLAKTSNPTSKSKQEKLAVKFSNLGPSNPLLPLVK